MSDEVRKLTGEQNDQFHSAGLEGENYQNHDSVITKH